MTTSISGTSGVTFPAGGVGNPASAVVGLTDTQTLTNKTINGSQLVAASVTLTQLALSAQGIGADQTWQSPTRTYDVTYTNSTGRSIQVVICVTPAANSGYFTVECGGISLAYLGVLTGPQSVIPSLASFIVPNAATYRCNFTSGALPTIVFWSELR